MSLFEEIYNLAKQHDEVGLQNLLKLYPGCIDKSNPGTKSRSAAATLAYENNRLAANLLLALGANINLIAVGATLGNHFDYVKELSNKGANIKWITEVFKRAGKTEQAEKLQELIRKIDLSVSSQPGPLANTTYQTLSSLLNLSNDVVSTPRPVVTLSNEEKIVLLEAEKEDMQKSLDSLKNENVTLKKNQQLLINHIESVTQQPLPPKISKQLSDDILPTSQAFPCFFPNVPSPGIVSNFLRREQSNVAQYSHSLLRKRLHDDSRLEPGTNDPKRFRRF